MNASLTSDVEPASVSAEVALGRGGPIRVLAFMEATWLTGPAKNLIEFARRAKQAERPQANVEVVTFQRGRAAPGSFISGCHQAGIHTYIIEERYAFDPRVVFAVRDLIASEKPDIIQTHSVKSHFLIKLTRAYRTTKWIAFHHGYTWPDNKMRLYNQLDRLSLPSAHQVVTVCRPFARALQEIGVTQQRITVQHNSVEPVAACSRDTVSELRTNLGIRAGATVLLTVGRLSREKGHFDLIAAINQLRNASPGFDFQLVIVGDGPERPRIEAAARKYGLSDSVILGGQQTALAPYYSLADIAVLPSHSEGSPNVLLEAMSAGLPVVATKVGGVPEIATDGRDALLVEKQRPELLANAISRLIENMDLQRQLGERARVRSRTFSAEAYCRSILGLYSRASGHAHAEEID